MCNFRCPSNFRALIEAMCAYDFNERLTINEVVERIEAMDDSIVPLGKDGGSCALPDSKKYGKAVSPSPFVSVICTRICFSVRRWQDEQNDDFYILDTAAGKDHQPLVDRDGRNAVDGHSCDIEPGGDSGYASEGDIRPYSNDDASDASEDEEDVA